MRSRLQKTITALLFLSPFLVIGQSSKRPKVKTHKVSIEPAATFLNLSPLDITRVYKNGRLVQTYDASDYSPSFFSLSQENPIRAGDILYLKAEGEYDNNRESEDFILTDDNLIGVFVDSQGNKLYPGGRSDYFSPVTAPSHRSPSVKTDIYQDFWIPSNSEQCVRVEVPAEAERILFSVVDTHFSDNEDKDGDFESKVVQIIRKPYAGVWHSNPVQVILSPQLDPSHHYDWPYDLVENKPFIVEASFQKLLSNSVEREQREEFDRMIFSPELKIKVKRKNRKSRIITRIKICSNKFGRGSESETTSKENCSFRGSDFILWDNPQPEGHIIRYGTFRQVFLVEGLKAGKYELEVDLYPNEDLPCNDIETSSEFEVEVHKTYSPVIGIARAHCEHISTGCTVEPEEFKMFLNKTENTELELFNKLFPVEEGSKKFTSADYNTAPRPTNMAIKLIEDSFKATADLLQIFRSQEAQIKRNIRIALQTKKLASYTASFRYNYLVGIGPGIFFTSDKGLKLRNTPAGIAFLNYRVAFINSNQIDKGTLLHELGHLIGGAKDFYKIIDEEENDISDKCTGHDLKIRDENWNFSATPIPCYRFNTADPNKQGRYEYYDFHNRQFVKKRHSIMGNSSNINEQTIDRDTYIKAFKHLKSKPKDPALTLISGIYANGRLFDAKVSNHGAGLLHPLSTEGDLHIMLKNSSDEILVETKLPSSFKIEVLSSTGGGEHITSNIVPIVVAFPYQATAVKAVIMKRNEDGTETMVFSKALPIDNNPKHLFSSHQAYSTVNNFPALKKNNTVELLKKGARKATSSAWTKFMYSPGFELTFEYNACGNQNRAGDGIALLLAKEPADYTASGLLKSNQGVNFNRKGLSLHLDMSGNIYLKDGSGQNLATAVQTVNTGCNHWKRLKLKIEREGKLTLLDGENSLLSYDLTLDQIEGIASHPIAFNAYSQRQGQYKIRKVNVKALPVETTEEDTNEEETDEEDNE